MDISQSVVLANKACGFSKNRKYIFNQRAVYCISPRKDVVNSDQEERKHLMLFVWLMLYGGINTVAKWLSQRIGMAHSVTASAMILYVVLLLLWLYRTDQLQEFGLRLISSAQWKEYLFFLPLWTMPIYNIITGSSWEISFAAAVLMLCVSVAEELFFRGAILLHLCKWSKQGGMILSSALFALAHLANCHLVSNSVYMLMQVMCAFAVGISFSAVTIKSGSLLP